MLDLMPDIIEKFKSFDIKLLTAYPSDSNSVSYPCVTYFDYANEDKVIGDNMGYSDISYKFEVWSLTIADRIRLAKTIDMMMKSLRFKRTMAEPQFLHGKYRYILIYKRTMFENYEEEN